MCEKNTEKEREREKGRKKERKKERSRTNEGVREASRQEREVADPVSHEDPKLAQRSFTCTRCRQKTHTSAADYTTTCSTLPYSPTEKEKKHSLSFFFNPAL